MGQRCTVRDLPTSRWCGEQRACGRGHGGEVASEMGRVGMKRSEGRYWLSGLAVAVANATLTSFLSFACH